MSTSSSTDNRNFWQAILKAGLLVGCLDITSALVYFAIRTGRDPLIVLKYISSAVLGKRAFTGGVAVILLGLLFHFIIAFTFTLLFFILYPKLAGFTKNKLLTAILYGLFMWTVMNLLVVPMTLILRAQFNWTAAIINMLILIVAIGLPLSWLANRFYKQPSSLAATALA
jgi:hypothetical protein